MMENNAAVESRTAGLKKSWSELKNVVCELRRRLSGLSTMVPGSVTFRALADGRTRVYFLSTPANGWETTLLYADVAGGGRAAAGGRLAWQPCIEANFQGVTGAGRFSREEQLLWERKRLATWGITSYELHHGSGKLVFPAASSLFQCLDTGFSNGPLFPAELRMNSSGAKLNPQICPSNPDLIAYVCNNDIWVTHTLTGISLRVTFAHKGLENLVDDPLSAGIPSYVMQEEFSRYQGYWWQPKFSDGVYRILYEEVDESDVRIFCFPTSNSNFGEVEEFRFPRAGTPNAKSNLKLVQFRLNESLQITDLITLELQYPLSVMFPWMEYLVRVGWTPNAEFVWVQLLDRRQQRLELVLLSVDNFMEPPPNTYSLDHSADPPAPAVHVIQVINTQHSDVWINVNDLLYFFPPSECKSEIKFLWASEETGFRHLYLITAHVSGVSNGIDDTHDTMESVFLQPRLGQKLALTAGEWEVLGRSLWVDAGRQLVYFLGLRESPLEKHLYVVSLRRPGEVRLLTRPGYSYSVEFDKECTMFVAVYSNIQKLPACQVFRISHSDWTVEGVTLTPFGYLLEPSVPEGEFFCPELYTHQISSGDLLYAMVFKPHCFQAGRKYPTVLNIYGGPEVQLVSNTFKGMRQLRMHMLAAQGYCVIAIDSRGSQHRGLQFESHLRGRMGTVELADQIEVLQWLADSLGFIDMSRVAIHGWSYGGYLSLMALAQHADIFKLAIAGAPVTSWTLYDTGYTERYMDLPEYNQAGYKNGSILTYVNQFPDDENRLLIIHGLIDENVHFFHTSQFISAMVKAGKPYQLQIYPNERHSLRHLDASKHYETTLLSFLQNHL
ncbi:dipeptidyl peptidase 9 [Bacillus rossius redtenbacheri]|uniref:dipeptidyl peptidase 9 n=1 Tax=Bacillus rossius redtenbacheri TaxID=93214 RepID=UPI002FDCDFE1